MLPVTTQFQAFPGQHGAYEKYRVANLRIVRGGASHTTNRCRARDTTVCNVRYEDISPAITALYELWQTSTGAYRFVSKTGDDMYYDSGYYNHEQNRVITLGRFTDERTASLAHALARSIPSLRFVENGAQRHIEALVKPNGGNSASHTGFSSTTLPGQAAGSSSTGPEDDGVDPLEIAQLFF